MGRHPKPFTKAAIKGATEQWAGRVGKPTRPGATDAIIILVDNRGLGPVRSRRPFSTTIWRRSV
jgi:hypothetical protein